MVFQTRRVPPVILDADWGILINCQAKIPSECLIEFWPGKDEEWCACAFQTLCSDFRRQLC